jgi:uncharacterized membrane protein
LEYDHGDTLQHTSGDEVVTGQSLVLPTMLALAMLLIGAASAARRFRFRHWAGLRTRATTASPEAWEAAHLAAAPWMIAGGLAGLAAGAVLSQPHWAAVVARRTPIAMGVDAVFLVIATIVAQRTASRLR